MFNRCLVLRDLCLFDDHGLIGHETTLEPDQSRSKSKTSQYTIEENKLRQRQLAQEYDQQQSPNESKSRENRYANLSKFHHTRWLPSEPTSTFESEETERERTVTSFRSFPSLPRLRLGLSQLIACLLRAVLDATVPGIETQSARWTIGARPAVGPTQMISRAMYRNCKNDFGD